MKQEMNKVSTGSCFKKREAIPAIPQALNVREWIVEVFVMPYLLASSAGRAENPPP
jgi:hypothetical protein